MHKHALPIWFFIGLLTGLYGVIILAAGLYDLISPPAVPLVLADLHAAIWWGLILTLLGGFYIYKFRPRPEQDVLPK